MIDKLQDIAGFPTVKQVQGGTGGQLPALLGHRPYMGQRGSGNQMTTLTPDAALIRLGYGLHLAVGEQGPLGVAGGSGGEADANRPVRVRWDSIWLLTVLPVVRHCRIGGRNQINPEVDGDPVDQVFGS